VEVEPPVVVLEQQVPQQVAMLVEPQQVVVVLEQQVPQQVAMLVEPQQVKALHLMEALQLEEPQQVV